MSGFISYDDPKMIATVEALRLDLGEEGFLYRYLADDGLPGREGTFLACTLWLITNLAKQGELEEAELLLTKVDQLAGPLHLLAEQYDPQWQEQLGNFPQAFSHEAYLTAATAIAHAKGEQRRRAFQEEYILPGRAEEREFPPPQPHQLADLLDEARGSLFGVEGAPVVTGHLRDLLSGLQGFNAETLKTREERTCFWCNLYNLLVLYGIATTGVEVSVKEIYRFYRRVGCRVGEQIFSCDIILNAILRGNRPAAGSFIPPLPPGDSRLSRSLRQSDPRVHFALWTGTRSSPPAIALRPETLDADLDRALRCFVRERSHIDVEGKRMVLPRIFKWYDDFGRTSRDIAVFVARSASEALRDAILQDPQSFTLEYSDYDWRLPH